MKEESRSTAGKPSQSMAIHTVQGKVIVLPGSDIDTDQIIPARSMRALTFEGIEKHLFEDMRQKQKQSHTPHPLDDPRFSGGSVLLVDDNFGCGSSREHAVQCLRRWGIQAMVGLSFAEIFYGNSVSVGMPCFSIGNEDHRTLKRLVQQWPRETITLDVRKATLQFQEFQCGLTMPEGMKNRFLNGTWNSLARLLEARPSIEKISQSLPYMKWKVSTV